MNIRCSPSADRARRGRAQAMAECADCQPPTKRKQRARAIGDAVARVAHRLEHAKRVVGTAGSGRPAPDAGVRECRQPVVRARDPTLREFTIRTAIGASQRRLLGQLVTESLLLSAIAGAVGLLLALWSVEAIAAILPEGGPLAADSTALDWRVLCYTLGISVAAGLVFGGLPALRFSRIAFTPALAPARSSSRIQRTLLVAQTAVAVTLLASAGLLTRSFLSLWRIDPGFRADNVLTARVSLPSNQHPDQQALFFTRAIERLSGPEIEAAAAVTHVPISGLGNSGYVTSKDASR